MNLRKFRKALLIIFLLVSFGITNAQIPAGYYDSADGKDGDELRTALYEIIKNHSIQSYGDLWTHFQSTDKKSNGEVWDMYSDNPGGTSSYTYTFSTDQCGSYADEGDCYNREHSFPQDWYNNGSPMGTDLFHIYPTDGYVNGKRSNYPYGEVGSVSWTSTNGSKLGDCSYPGCSGIVFEPIDEYKGDFARTYFYMVTRYKTNVSSWSSSMLSGDNLSSWAINMLLDWATNDPISQKEIDRNNAVYGIQGNRNPFIDNPLYKEYIWNGKVAGSHQALNETVKLTYASNKLVLDSDDHKEHTVLVYSVVGKVILKDTFSGTYQTNLSSLSDGMYMVVYDHAKQKIVVD